MEAVALPASKNKLKKQKNEQAHNQTAWPGSGLHTATIEAARSGCVAVGVTRSATRIA
jgi:hypothetical protein